MRWIWQVPGRIIRALFRTATGLLLVAALTLNLAMITLPAVFNAVSGLIWSAVSMVSSATTVRRETRATTAAALRSEADNLARTRARLTAAETDLETARARIITQDGENRRLASERDRIGQRLAATETDLETARARIVTQDGENRRLASERDRIGQRLAAADEELATFQRRLATLRTENARLQTSVKTSDARLDFLAAQQTSSSAEVGTIARRMQDRSIRMVSRTTASAFIETLPVVGGIAVLGTLAWDVHDTCQLLKDLHELQTKLALSGENRAEIEGGWCGLSAEDILDRLAGTASAEERACVFARIQTQTLDPPECAAFPFELPDYGDPLD